MSEELPHRPPVSAGVLGVVNACVYGHLVSLMNLSVVGSPPGRRPCFRLLNPSGAPPTKGIARGS